MLSLASYYTRDLLLLNIDCNCIQMSVGLLGLTVLLSKLLRFVKLKMRFTDVSLSVIRYL